MSGSTSSNASSNPYIVRVDWQETPVAHIIKADIPGVDGDDVEVETFDDGFLEIRGERVVEAEEGENSTWHMTECARGKFVRRLKLPENANLGELEPVVEDGVLTVTVPKKTDDQVVESSEGSSDREGFFVTDMLAQLTDS